MTTKQWVTAVSISEKSPHLIKCFSRVRVRALLKTSSLKKLTCLLTSMDLLQAEHRQCMKLCIKSTALDKANATNKSRYRFVGVWKVGLLGADGWE